MKMRRWNILLTVGLVLLLIPLAGWGQGRGWHWLTGGDLFGVHSFGQEVWAIGKVGAGSDNYVQGLILHSSDGGQNWEIQAHEAGLSFSDFSGSSVFLDANNGWIVGLDKVLRTRNGGQTWISIPGPGSVTGLRSIAVVDTLHFWVSSSFYDHDSIFRTTDGGATWQGSPADLVIYGMSFLDTLMGWAVASWGYIERTTDGGITWGHRSGPTQNLYCIEMFDTSTGLIAGDPNSIYSTIDGWTTWEAHPTGGHGSIRDISFLNAQVGLMAGSEGIYVTTDGGITWEWDSLSTEDFLGVDAKQLPTVWAVGQGSIIAKNTTGGIPPWTILRNIDSPGGGGGGAYWCELTSVSFCDPNNGWASSTVGGGVFHTTNGGTLWKRDTNQVLNTALSAINALDRNNIWTCGQDGRIYETTDGGVSWATKDTNQLYELFALSFGDSLWGVSTGGGYEGPPRNEYPYRVIKSTQDGGRTWQRTKTTHVPYLMGASAIKGGMGWICGGGGTIFRTSDYGLTWQAQNSGHTDQVLTGIVFLDSLHGWVCGTNGTTLWTTDGGNNWQTGTGGTTQNLYNCAFADTLHGFAVGNNGLITRTTDGGRNWLPDSSNLLTCLYGVFALDSTHVWIVGKFGVVLGWGDAGVYGIEAKGPGGQEASKRGVVLEQSYPNPMRENSAITFWLPKEEKAELSIYDVAGRKIREWEMGSREGGKQAIQWNGRDEKGRKVPGGVYFYRLSTGSLTKTRKMVVVR